MTRARASHHTKGWSLGAIGFVAAFSMLSMKAVGQVTPPPPAAAPSMPSIGRLPPPSVPAPGLPPLGAPPAMSPPAPVSSAPAANLHSAAPPPDDNSRRDLGFTLSSEAIPNGASGSVAVAPGAQCQEGHVRALDEGLAIKIAPVCSGPYQSLNQSRAIFLHFNSPRTVDFFDGGISADIAGAPSVVPTASTRKPVPAGLCPQLTSPPSPATAHDPRLICDCTEAYLRKLAAEATQFRSDHRSIAGDTKLAVSDEESYQRLAWAGLMQSGAKPPGWKWRCDMLDQKPEAEKPPADTTTDSGPPPLRPGETPQERAAEMRAYGEKMRDKMIAGLQATRESNTRNQNYAHRVGEIPDVAYLSVIGAQMSLWDLEETIFTQMALASADQFRKTVDRESFALGAAQARSLDSVGYARGRDGPVLELGAAAAQVEDACRTYDRAVDRAIDGAAAATRAFASTVRDAHDRLLREIKLWAAFAARDGFPRDGRTNLEGAQGGFLGLEPLLFDNPASFALHPGFTTRLRPLHRGWYFGATLIDARTGVLVPYTQGDTIRSYWESNPACRHINLTSLPADFEIDIVQEGLRPYAAGDTTGVIAALRQLAEDKTAAIWFRLDVLKANNFVALFAIGADPSESP